jgi:hypothetical protein
MKKNLAWIAGALMALAVGCAGSQKPDPAMPPPNPSDPAVSPNQPPPGDPSMAPPANPCQPAPQPPPK